jgi:hypothetical protein
MERGHVAGISIMIHEHEPPSADEPDATLRPPQFTLRTLLLAITGLAGLLAVMTAVGSLWAMALLLLVVLVSAHIVGNALGTKLNERSTHGVVPPGGGVPRAARPRPLASPKRLAEPSRLHWINPVMTAAGAAAGGYFGGSALAASYPDATTAAVSLGVVSSAVLGGFAGFAASSFLSVMRQALSEAHAASDKHPRAVRRMRE